MRKLSIENDIISRENEMIPSKEDCPWLKNIISQPLTLHNTQPKLKQHDHKWNQFLKNNTNTIEN
jgi:hypothetical protein